MVRFGWLADLMRGTYHAGEERRIRWVLVMVGTLALAACSRAEDRAEQHYRKGVELIAKGDDLNGRIELSAATKFKPDKIDAWRAQVAVNERIGAPALQFHALRRVVELDPNDEDAKIRLAKFMLRSGAADAALKMIDSVTRADEKADYHGIKAAIFLALKDGDKALQEARRAIEIEPANADAALVLASERITRNDLAEASRLLGAAKTTDPKDFRIALAKIDIFTRTGNLSQAETELRGLVEKSPQDAAMRSRLVQILAQQRKLEDAEKELRSIAELTPAESKPVLDLVRFIISTRGREAGRQELQARISKGGETFAYETALADIAIAERKPAEAVAILERLASGAKSPNDKNAAKVKLAEIKSSQKDLEGAERLIAEVLNADRRNVGALRLRASFRLNKGEVDAAVADLREALNEQPKAADLLLLMAQAYERNAQKELAERQYAEAVRASEFNSAVVLRYARFLQREGNSARAEEILIQATRASPNIYVLSSLAQLRLSRKNWTGALEIADIIASNPATKSLASQLRAAALAGQNKPEESIAALEQAHLAAPDSLPPVVSLARSYVAAKSYDKAEKLLLDMSRKFPDRAEFHVMLGQVELAKGVPSEAVKKFETAIQRQPKDPVGYTALVDLYNQQKKTEEALAAVERGLKELPSNVSLRTRLAGLKNAKGQYDAAIEIFEELAREQPGSLIAINNLASMLLEHRSDKQSRDRAQELAERLKGSQVPQLIDTVGWALYLRGDIAAARPMLEQAAAQLPDSANVRYHLGSLYNALGEKLKATEELNAAEQLVADEDGELKRKIRAALQPG